ncbi:MAG: hypothetical protein R3F65_29205 [bacterium]
MTRTRRARPAPALLAALLAALLLGLALSGCDDDRPRADVDAGDPTRCGVGPATITLGVDHPFVPTPDHRFPIDQGRQGGHHLDISIRATGALDPDHTDVELGLYDGAIRLARHVTVDWLLYIAPDGAGCDYPRARLVLLDEEGGLLPPDRVAALVGRPLRLDVHLRSPLGDADGEFTVTPTEIRPIE